MDPKVTACLKYFFRISYIVFPLILIVNPNNILPENISNSYVADFNRLDAERDPHSNFQDSNEGTMPTDPLQLMNVLRRATAMDDATSPSDALDEALKAFESQDQGVPINPVN